MDQYSHQSSQQDPLEFFNLPKHPKIQPLIRINPKINPIDKETLLKYSRSHSNTLKTVYTDLMQNDSLLYINLTKLVFKILQAQSQLSHLTYHIHHSRSFQNRYFSSKVKNLQSLSSLKLNLEGWTTISPQLKFAIKNLASLKQLTDFQIRFTFYDLTDSLELHKLFRRLLRLKKLTSFSFEMTSCARFGAKDFNIFFSYLSKFTQLQALKLSFSNLVQNNDQCILAVISALPSLTSVTQVDFNFGGYEHFQAENLVKLFVALGNIKTLIGVTLSLENCHMINKNDTSEPLSEGLKHLNCSSIKKLSLRPYDYFEIEDEFFQVLKRFTSLKILDLDLVDCAPNQMAELSSALGGLRSLTSLSLSFPSLRLAQNLLQSIACALESLQSLVGLKLELQGIRFTDNDQIQQFSSSLKALKHSLKFLALEFSEETATSDSTIQIYSEAVKELALLRHLSLNFSHSYRLTTRGLDTISSAIQDLSNLSYLALNFESNEDIREVNSLAQALRNIPSLDSVKFGFRRCNLRYEGNGLESLFCALGEMNNLGKINLYIRCDHEIEEGVKRLKRKRSVGIFWE